MMSTVPNAEDLSVRAIADSVGKTVPTLYQHFPDKTALLTAAATHALNRMGEAIDARVAEEVELDRRLRLRAHAFVDFATDNPTAYRHLFMSPPGRADNRDTIELVMASVGFEGMVDDLTQARAAGLMIDKNPRSVALILWTAVHGVASLMISHPDLDWPDDLLEQVLDQHAQGLQPR